MSRICGSTREKEENDDNSRKQKSVSVNELNDGEVRRYWSAEVPA